MFGGDGNRSPLERGVTFLEDEDFDPGESDNEDDQKLSRRKLLGGIAAVGAAGLATGAGTRAFFSDVELFANNRATSGDLDLRLAWKETYREADEESGSTLETGGEWPLDFQNPAYEDFTDTTNPVITLDGIEPGDTGGLATALHLFGNPGCIRGRLEAFDFDDNGLTSRERAADDTTGGPDEGELQDHLEVDLWYSLDCDTHLEGDECVIASGSLRDVSTALRNGFFLNRVNFAEGGCVADCQPLEKLNHVGNGEFEFDFMDDTDLLGSIDGSTYVFKEHDSGTNRHLTTLDIDFQENEEGEPISLDFRVIEGSPICRVEVKGGPDDPNVYRYPCATEASGLQAPFNQNSGTHYAISNIVFYYCPPYEKRCLQNSVTYCLGLRWTLPEDAPVTVETDSAGFELEFAAEQERHNPPHNPWGNDA